MKFEIKKLNIQGCMTLAKSKCDKNDTRLKKSTKFHNFLFCAVHIRMLTLLPPKICTHYEGKRNVDYFDPKTSDRKGRNSQQFSTTLTGLQSMTMTDIPTRAKDACYQETNRHNIRHCELIIALYKLVKQQSYQL